jgi:hypothetical protein
VASVVGDIAAVSHRRAAPCAQDDPHPSTGR